jgi:hypothetical protein
MAISAVQASQSIFATNKARSGYSPTRCGFALISRSGSSIDSRPLKQAQGEVPAMIVAVRTRRLWAAVGACASSVLALAIGFAGAAEAADKGSATSPSLSSRIIEGRAVEAIIWGMPVVNYDLMLQEMLTKTEGKVN